MSVIIEKSGVLSALQSLYPLKNDIGSFNGACDKLSFQLANTLVGNQRDTLALEMTAKPATILFTEPTIVAFSGADFNATCGDREITTNRVQLFDRGDRVEFNKASHGTRVYMAVAGGIKTDGKSILNSGDELIMCRDYSIKHDQLFNLMRRRENVHWGVDTYSLLEVYLSDIYHLVKRPDIDESIYEQIEKMTFEVKNETHRVAFDLIGEPLNIEVSDHIVSGIEGGVFLNENNLKVTLNDFDSDIQLPHLGTIPSYHMHKLSQKRPGSLIQFKCVDKDAAHANLYGFHLWVKGLFKAIDYKLSKELVKEKM